MTTTFPDDGDEKPVRRLRGGGDPDAEAEAGMLTDPRRLAELILNPAPKPPVSDGIDPERNPTW